MEVTGIEGAQPPENLMYESEQQAEVAPELKGPPDLIEADFAYVSHGETRLQMLQEYNRTVRAFRDTGEVRLKTSADFKHLGHPRGLADQVHNAHKQAFRTIGHWKDDQERKEKAGRHAEAGARAQSRAAALANANAETEEDEDADGDIEDSETEEGRSPLAENLADIRRRLELQKDRLAESEAAPAVAPPPPPPPLPLLRGEVFEADVPGRDWRYESRIAALAEAARPEGAGEPAVTESLLNAMIGECHFLMREVAFRSMCQAQVLEDRMRWVDAAMRLATTGADVAKGVARLRHGSTLR